MYFLYHKDTLEVEVMRSSQEEYLNIFMGICSNKSDGSGTKLVISQELGSLRTWFMDVETIKPLNVVKLRST